MIYVKSLKRLLNNGTAMLIYGCIPMVKFRRNICLESFLGETR
jgi:hypothetical protein